jgi:hypothetical protein
MSGTTHQMTHHHIPQGLNPQQHHCENLKSKMISIFVGYKYILQTLGTLQLMLLFGCILPAAKW